jgi:hypothetical protein
MHPGFVTLKAAQDAAKGKTYKTEKAAYEKVRRAEIQYGIRLRKIARNVGEIVGLFKPGDPDQLPRLQALLRKYAELIKPWAEVVAAGMLADVSYRDEQNWNELAKNMGQALRDEMRKAPTGETLKALQAQQVSLITSIPLDAAKRVHELTMEGLISSARYEDIKADILRTSHVTESRATLIARTEVGRASTNLAQARAVYVGSEGYIWRTARDSDVRNVDGNPVGSHRLLEGKFIRWDSPPIASTNGKRAHAGCIYRCRCWPEIVLPEVFQFGQRRAA